MVTSRIFILFWAAICVGGKGVEEEKKLVEMIKSNLTLHMAPTDMVHNSVIVNVDFDQIMAVEEKNSLWTVRLRLEYYYKVDSVQWNPEEFNGNSILFFPKNTFWTPDIVFENSVQVLDKSSEDQSVQSAGHVVAWASLITASFSCHFNVTFFPFDQQTCDIGIIKWVSDPEDYCMKLEYSSALTDEAALERYQEHDQWELVRPVMLTTPAESDDDWCERISLRINLKRRPNFYFNILLFPNFIIYALSALVFLLPVDCGEKVSFAVTLLLTKMVTFATLAQIFPESSRNFPIIALFACKVTVHLAVICLIAVVVVKVHFIGDDSKMTSKLRMLLGSQLVRIVGMQPLQSIKTDAIFTRASSATKVQPVEVINSEDKDDPNGVIGNEWKFLAAFLDRLGLLAHLIIQFGLILDLWIKVSK